MSSPKKLEDEIDVGFLDTLLKNEDFDIFNHLNIHEEKQGETVALEDIQIDPSFTSSYVTNTSHSFPFDSYLNKDFLTETIVLHPDHPNESPLPGWGSSISTTPESRSSFYCCSSRDSFSSRSTINSQSTRQPNTAYAAGVGAVSAMTDAFVEPRTPPSSNSFVKPDELFFSLLNSNTSKYLTKPEEDSLAVPSPRSYQLASLGSGQCSSGTTSPERKHFAGQQNNYYQPKLQEDSPPTTTFNYGGRHLSRCSSRRKLSSPYSSTSGDNPERARSPVLPMQRHKRHSHIRAEKKRKARIQEEFSSLKSALRRAQGNKDIEDSAESFPKALQLKQGADCLRKLQLENKLAEVEYNSLLQEKNLQKQILERSWQRMDVSNKHLSHLTSEQGGSLAQKIYCYHESRQATFGLKFKIFQEIVEPLTATLFLHLQSENDLPTQAVHFHEQMLQQLRQSLLNTHSSLQNLFWKSNHHQSTS